MNLANGDMVGHTGDLQATIAGCEAVDQAVKVVAYLVLCLLLKPTKLLVA